MIRKTWKLIAAWSFLIPLFACLAMGQENNTVAPGSELHPLSVIFEPVTKALEYSPIDIVIKISGFDLKDKMILHFRDTGESDFYAIPFGLDNNTQNFVATIDERYHSNQPIEYFVEIIRSDGTRIRYPSDNLTYYEIKSYKNSAKYIRAVLYFLLISAPALLYYLATKLFKAHVHRTTAYQQKLSKRRRQLAKQREKHYQEYLQKLSGAKMGNTRSETSASPRKKRSQNIKYVDLDEVQPPAEIPTPIPEQAQAVPPRLPPVKESPLNEPKQDDRISTSELKRELDEILSGQRSERTPPAAAATPAASAADQQPVPPAATAPVRSPAVQQPQPRPVKPSPRPVKPPSRPTETKSAIKETPSGQDSDESGLDSRAAWHMKKLMQKKAAQTPPPRTVTTKTAPISPPPIQPRKITQQQLEKTDPNLRIDKIVNEADLFEIEDDEVSASLEAEFKAAVKKPSPPPAPAVKSVPPRKPLPSADSKPKTPLVKPDAKGPAQQKGPLPPEGITPKKSKDLNKSERDQILDILGLDDI